MAKKIVLSEIQVETKQLDQAIDLIKQLGAEIEKLKKQGAAIQVIQEQEKKLKAVVRAAETLRDTEKSTLPFGIKKLELSKLQLQQAKALAKEAEQREKAQAKADAAEAKAMQNMLDAGRKQQAQLETENELLSREATTIAEIEKQNALLVKQRKQMKIDTAENAEAFNALTARIKANQERLNAFNEDIGRHQGKVGDYLSVWQGMPGALGATGNAVEGVGAAFKALLANPIVAVFAAISAALIFLGQQFLKTERGTKMWAQASAFLDAALINLRKGLSDLANTLANLNFDKFKAAFLDTSYIKTFVAAIDTIKAVFTGDFKKAGESFLDWAKNAKDGLIQMVFPVYALRDAFKETSKSATELANARLLLDKQTSNTAYATMALTEQLTKLRGEQELNRAIVDDDKRAWTERLAAVQRLTSASEKVAKLELIMAQNTKTLADSEVELGKKRGATSAEMLTLYQAQNAAQVALLEAENRRVLTIQDNSEIIKRLNTDYSEQQLDVIFDVYDAVKSAAERELQLASTTQARREQILAQQKEQAARAQDDTLVIFQQYAKKRIDLDAILAESDAKKQWAMVQALGMDEIMTNRFRERMIETTSYMQDFKEMEIDVAQAGADARLAAYNKDVETFEKEQELATLAMESKQTTEEEKARFEIEQQIALDEEKLRLAEEHGLAMSDLEKRILEQRIANGQAELEAQKQVSEGKMALKEAEKLSLMGALQIAQMVAGEETKIGKLLGQAQKILTVRKVFLSSQEALAKAWASAPFPFNLPAVGAVALNTGLITAAVSAVKFRRGGIIDGPSHEGGGVPVMGGRAEVEGGEFVVNKRATRAFLPQLNAINSYNGWGDVAAGAPKFASGGTLPTSDRTSQRIQDSLPRTVEVFTPVLVLEDLQDVQTSAARVAKIQEGF